MALDIHRLQPGGAAELLFQIDDELYKILLPAFGLYRDRSGIFIDPYGDTKFSSGLSSLISALKDWEKGVSGRIDEQYEDFYRALSTWDAEGLSVIFQGD